MPFMKVSQLLVETLLQEIERVLQSNEQFVLDDSLDIEMTHVKLPTGGQQILSLFLIVRIHCFVFKKRSKSTN
jgi:hypothetical protein